MKEAIKFNNQTVQEPVLYEIQVGGIKCVNCAKKITDNLNQIEGVIKISVNVLAEKVQVVFHPEIISIDKIQEKLHDLKFQILQIPTEINFADQKSENKRNIYFVIQYKQNKQQNQKADEEKLIPINEQNYQEKIKEKLTEQYGVLQIVANQDLQNVQKIQLKVEYSPKIIKASQIYNLLFEYQHSIDIEVKDVYLESFKKTSNYRAQHQLQDLILSLFLIVLFLIMVLIIPQFEFFDDAYIYPSSWNVFSIFLISVFMVTNFVMVKFGLKTFISTYTNYFKYKVLNMETLITIGSVASYIMGVFLSIMYLIENSDKEGLDQSNLNHHQKMDRRHQIEMIAHMFESSSLILLIVVLGKFLEGLAKQTIVKMIQNMFPQDQLIGNSIVKYLELKNRNFVIEREQDQEVSLIEKGDLIKIEPGQKLLVDGVVLKIDKDLKAIDSVCYGWDEPFTVNKGDRLKSGASVAQGSGILQVEETIENSMLFKISNQLNMSQNDQESQEDGIQGLFKLLSNYFVKVVLISALIVLIVWIILIATDSVEIDEYCVYCQPFLNSISVLVASCPCALGLAIPIVITITLNLAMKNSILLKKNSIFEKISQVQSVIFDKTGTLFTKVNKIQDYRLVSPNYTLEEIWETISLVEKQSRHPIAELLYKESLNHIKNSLNLNFVLEGEIEFNKKGLKAIIQHKQKGDEKIQFLIGNKGLMLENNINIDTESMQYLNQQGENGHTCLLLALNGSLVFQISLDNTANLRQEAPAVIEYLQKELKKDVYILSGDAQETVKKVGEHLNIPLENLIGETDAESKKKLIKNLKQQTNKEVMMIGDGLNDILSIQEAGIGVTINAKSELNLLASDVVALNENLWKIVSIFKLMKISKQFIILNLFWASIYNIIMLPISAGVFYSLDFTISPTIASAAMSGSSLVVVLFSSIMRLIQFDVSNSKIGQKYIENANKRLGIKQKYIDGGIRKQELVNQIE